MRLASNRGVDMLKAIGTISRANMVDEEEAKGVEAVVHRNKQGLSGRHHGQPTRSGEALFPLAALCNHSCLPNAAVHYDNVAGVLRVRALRDIRPGDEVTISYIDLGTGYVGARRRELLKQSFGFVCQCAACMASAGSMLYELERRQLGMCCPSGKGGHVLLPDDPYAISPVYVCTAPGCQHTLSAEVAATTADECRVAFEALRAPYEQGLFAAGCRVATAAEETARKVLAPTHHGWMLWVAGTAALAGGASDTSLLTAAHAKREAMRAGAHQASEEDVSMRLQYAIASGLKTSQAVAAFRSAFEVDRYLRPAPTTLSRPPTPRLASPRLAPPRPAPRPISTRHLPL